MVLHDLPATVVHFGDFALFGFVDVRNVTWWVDEVQGDFVQFAELHVTLGRWL